ncbi:MAG: acyltransferase family protein [Polymorphobacter sp.]
MVATIGSGPATGGLASHRYEALDGLRGLCALCVCLFHFRANGPIAPSDFVRGSWLFVDFFFVLSGFVIAATYRARLVGGEYLRSFAILRIGRVYPLHLVMLAAFVIMEIAGTVLASKGLMKRAAFDDHHSLFAIFTNLTLTQAFGLHKGLTWNQPSWSIAVEVWTYLLFALAAFAAGAWLERWLAVAIIVCIAVLAVATPYGINVSHSWSLFRCVYGFAVGAIAWKWWQGRGAAPGPASGGTVIELVTVAAVVAFVAILSATWANLLSPLVFGAAVLVFARQAGAVWRWLMTAPLRRLGVLSYSIYMVHTFVQSRMDDALRVIAKLTGVTLFVVEKGGSGAHDLVGATPLQGVLLTLVMLALVILVASLTWRWVEVPGQAWSRRLAKRAA